MPTSNSNTSFPSLEDMQKNSKKPPHFILAIIILVAVGLGIIWYLYKSNNELDKYFSSGGVHKSTTTNELEPQSQLDDINVGDLDAEFSGIDQDINGL